MIYIYMYTHIYIIYSFIKCIITIPIVGHRNQSHALAAGPRNRCQRVADDRHVLWILVVTIW